MNEIFCCINIKLYLIQYFIHMRSFCPHNLKMYTFFTVNQLFILNPSCIEFSKYIFYLFAKCLFRVTTGVTHSKLQLCNSSSPKGGIFVFYSYIEKSEQKHSAQIHWRKKVISVSNDTRVSNPLWVKNHHLYFSNHSNALGHNMTSVNKSVC